MAPRIPRLEGAAAHARPTGGDAQLLERVEREVARVVRRTVVTALHANATAGRDRDAQPIFVLNDGIGVEGVQLAANAKAIACGVIAGVLDSGGDLARAAQEIVRIAMQQAQLAGADVALVALRAIDGVTLGAAEAGADPTETIRAASRNALRTAAGLSVIAAKTIRVVLGDALDVLAPAPVMAATS